MRKILVLLALLVLVIPSAAAAAYQDSIIMVGKDAHVPAGKVISGDVVVFGADAVIEGHVRDSVVAIFGNIYLEPNAVVDGSVVAIGGSLTSKAGAEIGGEQVSIGLGDINMGDFSRLNIRPFRFNASVASLWETLSIVLFGWVLFWLFPGPVLKIGAAAQADPLKSVLFGLLGYLAVIPLTIIMLITLVGIPLIPVLWLALFVARLLGQVALGLLAGRYLAQRLNREMTDTVAVVVGVFSLGLLTMIPVLGGLASLFYSLLGFGAAVWTKLGRVGTV